MTMSKGWVTVTYNNQDLKSFDLEDFIDMIWKLLGNRLASIKQKEKQKWSS